MTHLIDVMAGKDAKAGGLAWLELGAITNSEREFRDLVRDHLDDERPLAFRVIEEKIPREGQRPTRYFTTNLTAAGRTDAGC